MSNQNPLNEEQIVRAWKDREYLLGLTKEQREYAFQNYPAGAVELSDDELEAIAGGRAEDSSCWSDSCNSGEIR